MSVNSKQKGARGEREWAKFCREQGYEKSRRTQQYAGGTEESSDCVGLPYIHQEVKRVEKLNIDDAIEQAYSDWTKGIKDFSKQDWSARTIPIVAHRKNGKQWKVTMYADDWFKLYREWESGKRIQKLEGANNDA